VSTVSISLPRVIARRRLVRLDWQLLVYLLLLVAFGWILGFSAGFGSDPTAGTLSQSIRTIIWLAAGLTGFAVAAAIDYRWLRTAAVPLYLLTLALLVLTLVLGADTDGSQLSVSIGGLAFQFSEISKVLVAVVLAAFLVSRGDRVSRLSTIIGSLLLVGLPAFLVFRQPDLGTALVFGAIALVMLFMAGASVGWLAALGGLVVAALPAIVGSLHEYQRARLLCFLDPSADPQGACYQLAQSISAVGSGGLVGQGLTAGRHNQLGYLPVQSTDFIFTVVAEELGFVGSMVLLALFGLLVWRILRIAWTAPDSLGRLLAVGVATIIVFQVLINVGMVIGIMPVTGIPLPFITYGGSSLVSLCIGLGLVESVRVHADRHRF
jgi:rod shape determining protein RodA